MRKASSSNNKTYTNEGQKYKIQKKYTTTNDREKPNTEQQLQQQQQNCEILASRK